MNYVPRHPRTAAVGVPRARMVEPHLLEPIRRPAAHLDPCWGGVLLLERHQAGPVRLALQEVARAWSKGIWLLNKGCIRHPLGELSGRHVERFGATYREGFYLRVEAPTPPPIFDMRRGGDYFRGRLPAGSWVECALSLFAALGHDGQPAIATEIEWLNVHATEQNPARWELRVPVEV